MKIICLPKFKFDEIVSNEDIKKYSDITAFISILDPDNEEKKFNESENFLQVKMWDVEMDVQDIITGEIYQKPSDEILIQIIEFVERNKDKKQFVIHCSMGVSRSGAVGRFIHEFLEENDESFYVTNKEIKPNLYILKRLKELYNNEDTIVENKILKIKRK